MRIDLDTGIPNANLINSYEPGELTVNQEKYTHSIILTPDTIVTTWEPQTIDMLTMESLEPVMQLNPEVVIIGSGENLRFPDQKILMPLFQKGIGVEVMITRSACYTYNVLMSESRRVLAALFLK